LRRARRSQPFALSLAEAIVASRLLALGMLASPLARLPVAAGDVGRPRFAGSLAVTAGALVREVTGAAFGRSASAFAV
jgi:hypothetical protein